MMLSPGMEQDTRTADSARNGVEEPRTFARRIDCASAPRAAEGGRVARGGAPRERDAWERSRPGYGG